MIRSIRSNVKLALLLLCILLNCPIFTQAAKIHVPAEQPTIRAGIFAASPGDTVTVAPGVYSGLDNRDIRFAGGGIVIMSDSGPANTIINCGGSHEDPHHWLYFQSDSVVIDGFTIENGSGIYTGVFEGYVGGPIVLTGGASLIRNCVFRSNHSTYGSCIAISFGDVVLENCVFHDNIADSAYLILSVEANAIFRNCTFYGNVAHSDWPWLVGNYDFSLYDQIQFDNCVFSNNSGGVLSSGVEIAFSCCVFYNNDNEAPFAEEPDSLGNVITDPQFCEPLNDDFALFDVSICAPENNTCNELIGALSISCTYDCIDSDSDGFGDSDILFNDCPEDNCPSVYNPSQVDTDLDKIGDDCDNCVLVFNPDQSDMDLDNIGDSCDTDIDGDSILNVDDPCPLNPVNPCCCDVAGDADNGGDINIGDATFVVKYVFQGGNAPICLDQADADGSNDVNIGDATHIVKFVFQGGGSPICGITGS